jgi:hypothetical protein
MGVSCIVDSIMGKMGLISEQYVTNPVAQFQLATLVHRFKMLNVVDVVQIPSFCV